MSKGRAGAVGPGDGGISAVSAHDRELGHSVRPRLTRRLASLSLAAVRDGAPMPKCQSSSMRAVASGGDAHASSQGPGDATSGSRA